MQFWLNPLCTSWFVHKRDLNSNCTFNTCTARRAFVVVLLFCAVHILRSSLTHKLKLPTTYTTYICCLLAGKYSTNALLQLFRPHESRMHCSCCKYNPVVSASVIISRGVCVICFIIHISADELFLKTIHLSIAN